MIEPLDAVILGAVEGLTEFLPISSTGHLILVSHGLGLHGTAVNAFEIVIQAGALAAVAGLYRARIAQMLRGLLGQHTVGRSLLINLGISFLPAGILGLLFHEAIKSQLFKTWPVVAALALGGLVMIAVDRQAARRQDAPSCRTIDSISPIEAAMIGLAQCLALWPGTSRAMVTLVAGFLCGLPASAAAEYSFLLALPTLGAAVLFDAAKSGPVLLEQVPALSLGLGLSTAAVVAAIAVRGFITYLSHRGLGLFGWYRLALSAAVWFFLL
jgi:undecaprenyl-diphosphatase